MGPALAAGALTVPSAEIPFAIRDGQVRVSNTTLAGEGARLNLSGGYDIAADQIDVRAALAATVTDAANLGRPEILVLLFGSPDKPARSIDVAALSSWLGLRAIDRETKRLDAIERNNPLLKSAAAARAGTGATSGATCAATSADLTACRSAARLSSGSRAAVAAANRSAAAARRASTAAPGRSAQHPAEPAAAVDVLSLS